MAIFTGVPTFSTMPFYGIPPLVANISGTNYFYNVENWPVTSPTVNVKATNGYGQKIDEVNYAMNDDTVSTTITYSSAQIKLPLNQIVNLSGEATQYFASNVGRALNKGAWETAPVTFTKI